MTVLREMLRKDVVVTAGGTTYEGTLIEVSDDEVLLKTTRGWVSVQMSRVTAVNLKEGNSGFASNRFVDPSFYDMDLE